MGSLGVSSAPGEAVTTRCELSLRCESEGKNDRFVEASFLMLLASSQGVFNPLAANRKECKAPRRQL